MFPPRLTLSLTYSWLQKGEKEIHIGELIKLLGILMLATKFESSSPAFFSLNMVHSKYDPASPLGRQECHTTDLMRYGLTFTF